jgi:HlyD family secretion protein
MSERRNERADNDQRPSISVLAVERSPGPAAKRSGIAISDTSGQDVALPPPSTRRRWLLGGALTVIALGAGAALAPWAMRWSQAEASVPRERLRLARVRHGDLVRDVSIEGRVVAAVSPTLFAPADGTITLLAVSGAEVMVGDELARIDSPELENRLRQEQSTLEAQHIELERQRIMTRQGQLQSQKTVDLAEVALVAARRELRRAQQAFDKNAIPEIDVEKASDEVHNAELGHEHALRDIELDRERLAFETRARELQVERQALLVADLERQVDELTIQSPVTGIVGNLQVDQKAAVTRNQAIMMVVDLTAFEVEAEVPESYGDDLGLGMIAEIRVGNSVHQANVVSISPEIVDNQVTTRLRFTDSPPDGLRQNQRLTTRILLEKRPNVLIVDRGQFLESGAGRVAYVVFDGIARRTPIEIGARSLSAVEILSGLQEGDTIITSSLEAFERADTVLVTN